MRLFSSYAVTVFWLCGHPTYIQYSKEAIWWRHCGLGSCILPSVECLFVDWPSVAFSSLRYPSVNTTGQAEYWCRMALLKVGLELQLVKLGLSLALVFGLVFSSIPFPKAVVMLQKLIYTTGRSYLVFLQVIDTFYFTYLFYYKSIVKHMKYLLQQQPCTDLAVRRSSYAFKRNLGCNFCGRMG